MKKVVILQHRLLHYRVALFDRLRQICSAQGIELELVHGQATRREKNKKDEGQLPWAHRVVNRFWEVGERDWVWQPLPPGLRSADLVIVMQENRILSNYPVLMRRLGSPTKVAYWGHGKNFQSDAPTGLRERWKSWLMHRVDWWFAYTDATVDLLAQAGYPAQRITCLDNAIDTTSFRRDLASWADADVAQARRDMHIPLDAPVGLYCGSLYPDKRLDVLVDAVDRIRQRMPGFVLLVVGDGPEMPWLREAAATRAHIRPMGVRTGRDKALYFRMADVVLNPGLVGLHIVDAFCAGLVMVSLRASRHSPEIAYLRDGDNGLLTENDVSAYADAVLQLLANPQRMQRMRTQALADADRYTLDNMVRRFAHGIASALEAPPYRRGV